jgi:serine/threonine-protein kinase HipA
MKFAMAVGDNRHYVVDEILPRHFAQSAKAAGVSTQQIQQLLHGVEEDAPDALDRAAKAMPDEATAGFNEAIRAAAARRLREIETFLDQ